MQENAEPRPLKRVVIKEEFVALTGDHTKAVLLAQLEYWQRRVRDIDKYIAEEKQRASVEGNEVNLPETAGWIYKKAEELAEETMLNSSVSTVRRHLGSLVKAGWVLERSNPHHRWDRTKQYRFDAAKVGRDLREIGYELQGWVIRPESGDAADKGRGDQNETPSFQNENTRSNNENSKTDDETAIPEITSEITDREKKNSPDPFGDIELGKDNVHYLDDETRRAVDILAKLPAWSKSRAETAEIIARLSTDFPTASVGQTVEAFEYAVRYGKKYKNIALGLRNWFKNAEKYDPKPTATSSSPGESSAPLAGGSPASVVAALKDHERLSRFAAVAERWDFTLEEEPPFKVLARLGGTDDERYRNLKSLQSVARRAVREARLAEEAG